MKHILVLTTGGTIACTPSGSGQGLTPSLSGEELIACIPEVVSYCDISIRRVMNMDSSNMSPPDWIEIARVVHEAIKGFDGIVITHGTDTMAYTACALSFMLQNPGKPVALTGSQLSILHPQSDGRRNLLDACITAAADIPAVCVVFNGKIILGCRAFKMHSRKPDAYISRNYPYLGYIRDKKAVLARKLPQGPALPVFSDTLCEDVFLLKLVPGTKPSIAEYILQYHYRGVVIESFGLGGIPYLRDDILGMIRFLSQEHNIPVVVITQCLYDGTSLNVYDVGVKAAQAGAIAGYDMTTEAAVTKLMWILGKTGEPARVRREIQTNYCDEITLKAV
jgi:L-asparaginase